MKLGKYAKEREIRVLKHLYHNPNQTTYKIQSTLMKQNRIDVIENLTDLKRMKLVQSTILGKKILWKLTRKGKKVIKKIIKGKKY